MELIVFLTVFLVGLTLFRKYEAYKEEKESKRAAYIAIDDLEKLIAQIEENRNPREIRRLLDIATLDHSRQADGVTPIIATMRYVPKTNYRNSSRRHRILREIAGRLPEERLVPALNLPDRSGWTALMYAAQQSDVSGGALLIHLGADPTVQNSQGQTAADIASQWPTVVPVFEGRDVSSKLPAAG